MSAFHTTWLSPSKIVLSSDARVKDWRDQHRMKVPGHEYAPSFKKGKWDGTWMPGEWLRANGEGYEFCVSRGLLPRIAAELGDDPAQVIPRPPLPVPLDAYAARIPEMATLRDYQMMAWTQILTNGWGRIAFATNAGKGAVIALLARYAVDAGYRAIVLCDEVAVFDALQGELATWGLFTEDRIGLVRAGCDTPPTDALVTLAMVPTLNKRLVDPSRKGADWRAWAKLHAMVLLDEADKAAAPTWRAILANLPNSVWRAGFSGTFGRDLYHELIFDELMGPVLAAVRNKDMVERGVSARPMLELHTYDATASLVNFPRNWFQVDPASRRRWAYETALVYNADRHAFIRNLVRPGIPTAIVINRVDHGTALAEAIPGAVFIDGSVADADRITALEAFQRGDIKVLIVTKILDRGTNRLGHAEDLIFASGEGSSTQVLQRIGRGLRRGGGKATLRLVDVVDRIDTMGRDKRFANVGSFFHGAARRRLTVYATEGFDIIPGGRGVMQTGTQPIPEVVAAHQMAETTA